MNDFSDVRKQAIVCLFLFSLVCMAADAQSSGTPSGQPNATPAASDSEDLSKYKTADELYAHYQDQVNSLKSRFQTQGKAGMPKINLTERQAVLTNLIEVLTEFINRYGTDARVWNSKLTLIDLKVSMARITGGDISAFEKDYQALVDDANTPKEIANKAYVRIEEPKFAKLLQTQNPTDTTWNALDKVITDINSRMSDSPNLMAQLRKAELDAMVRAGATQRFQALVTQLKSDPNSSVVTMATAAEKEHTMLEGLYTKPMDLKFTSVDGTEVDLSKWRGKVVLIDFWATWCGPCKGEVPNVVATYQKFHGQGFEIAGISLDQDKDSLLKYTKDNGMVWPQYFDGKGWQNSISSPLGIQSIPAMWLLNKKGLLVTVNGREDLSGQVEKLLKE